MMKSSSLWLWNNNHETKVRHWNNFPLLCGLNYLMHEHHMPMPLLTMSKTLIPLRIWSIAYEWLRIKTIQKVSDDFIRILFEKAWCHNKMHNLCHNLSMWQVVVGGRVASHAPTITPPLTTTYHMGELWHKLYLLLWH